MKTSIIVKLTRNLFHTAALVFFCLGFFFTAEAQKRPSPQGNLVRAPEITSFFIEGDNASTDKCMVGLEVTWDTSRGDPTHLRISESSTFSNARWKAFTPTTPLIYEFHGGPPRFAKGRIVFVQLRKRVRLANTGAYLNYDSIPKSDSIVLLGQCSL